jgi:hypothetical protein
MTSAIAAGQPGRPPIPLHDPSFDATTQRNPIADCVGSANIERDTGEDVAQCALHGQAQDDREDS